MLRETKVGIVVSCSFLGLLGVVVSTKLREPAPTEKRSEASVQANQNEGRPDETNLSGEKKAEAVRTEVPGPLPSSVVQTRLDQPGSVSSLPKETRPAPAPVPEPILPPMSPTEPVAHPATPPEPGTPLPPSRVSKKSSNSVERSPCRLCPNSRRCASVDPDE